MSDDDVNNYNKIKTDLDKLRLLVEQSELWIYKKKENIKENNHDDSTLSSENKTTSSSTTTSNISNTLNSKLLFSVTKPIEDEEEEESNSEFNCNRAILLELDNGPELDQSAIAKYKELYKILNNMIKLCVNDQVKLTNGMSKKKARRNDQRLLRNMGVHNIVLDLTKIILKISYQLVLESSSKKELVILI